MVSVIVPVYNAEKTLEKCIESLISQTIECQLIFVDDGSTDYSLNILKDYESKHSNIKVISQNNGGVSKARNTGLEYVTGEFIGFADSDDWVEPNAYETLQNMLLTHSGSIAAFYSYDCNREGEKCLDVSYSQIIDLIVSSKEIGGYPWNKLFRKSIIDKYKIRFCEDIHSLEDKLFCLEYMNKSNGGGYSKL